MLLVHHNQTQIGHRGKQGAAGTHQNVHLAVQHVVPNIEPLSGRQPRMHDGHPARKPSGKPAHGLGRQGDLGHQDNRLPPPVKARLEHLEIYLGLAAARHALEHPGTVRRVIATSQYHLQRGFLFAGQRNGPRPRIGGPGQRIPRSAAVLQEYQAMLLQAPPGFEVAEFAGQIGLPGPSPHAGQGLQGRQPAARTAQGKPGLHDGSRLQREAHGPGIHADQPPVREGLQRRTVALAGRRLQFGAGQLRAAGCLAQAVQRLQQTHRARGPSGLKQSRNEVRLLDSQLEVPVHARPHGPAVLVPAQQARRHEQGQAGGKRGSVEGGHPSGQLQLPLAQHGCVLNQVQDEARGHRAGCRPPHDHPFDCPPAKGHAHHMARCQPRLQSVRNAVVKQLQTLCQG